ncbi:hypothetical protein J1P26_22185 [Neobacillus sp. MM2021_6]|uniref:hypothetical protein n=1 Tax=Bacillaceae TaxID=186817 RepID=UPI0014094DF0|nr:MULTISPECIES: hypothetical protein [Bacillaceae]MBO0962415.1 hypothetical protein [Neobacillus sp. MM2021_6]NHC21016.1 hypothetical protein [Bacillus sp. MM2020_4]
MKRMIQSFEFKFSGNINVQSMERQSGIFIGERNNAVGWSAHGKVNQVIGEIGGQSNLLYQNVSILNDPDYIDTPIDDRDINISFEDPGAEKTSNLTFDSVNVNTMLQNAMVSIGEGHITGMDANEKVNQAQGSTYGNQNQLFCNVNITNDNDTVDAIIEDADVKIANVNQE